MTVKTTVKAGSGPTIYRRYATVKGRLASIYKKYDTSIELKGSRVRISPSRRKALNGLCCWGLFALQHSGSEGDDIACYTESG